jgi:putative transposase
MPETARLSGGSDCTDLEFVEHERTPKPAMALGIQSHLAGLSLANTVDLLESLGVEALENRPRLGAESRSTPNLDSVRIRPRSTNQRFASTTRSFSCTLSPDVSDFWLADKNFALVNAADPQTNDLLRVRLFATTTTAFKEMFLRELQKNMMSKPPLFPDGVQPQRVAGAVPTDIRHPVDRNRVRVPLCSNCTLRPSAGSSCLRSGARRRATRR